MGGGGGMRISVGGGGGGGRRGEEEEGRGAHLQTPRGSGRAHGDRQSSAGGAAALGFLCVLAPREGGLR
uniref:Uncharacterized protein n=1 Tax=Arundo donax TaxID=35708 RepID=A0A0A9FC69_ARUDO